LNATADYRLLQLNMLEAESLHIIREVAAEFERPALLFSGGKDSLVMLRLAKKAFCPAAIPFPVLHVDTGHNLPEVVRYRTVGDMFCTRAVQSSASTVEEIISEIAATRITERGATRADDRTSEAAMEDRKKEGYF
jgi:sulfate adenylyltransferase subunit 2